MKKLKLTRIKPKKEMIYEVECPERMKNNANSCNIVFDFADGEYQYIPRRLTLIQNISFTSDELRAIADELDKINKDKKENEN